MATHNTETQRLVRLGGSSSGAGTGDVTGPAASVDSEVAIYSGTSGKTLKRASATGTAILTSGVLSAATPIIGASDKTKLTYSNNGLITSGTDATTADIADSSNKRYVTDAQLTILGNTSGTNTGDQTTVSGNAGTATALQTARNINGVSFNGTANITVLPSVTDDVQTKAAIVPNTAPAAGDILIGNAGGTAYAKNALSGGGTVTSAGVLSVKVEVGQACSDQTTAITTGTAKRTFYMPFDMSLTSVIFTMITAPTGSTAIFDVKANGTTLFSTKPSIDASEHTTGTAATASVLTSTPTALTKYTEMTVNIDQTGASVAGAGVELILVGTRNS